MSCTAGGNQRSFRALLVDERGAEQLEYMVILAGVVLPMFYAGQIMWDVLLYYFMVESFVVDLPFF